MIKLFNINFDNIYKKENQGKFMVMGLLLLCFGAYSFFNKYIGIKVISFSISLLLIFFAYLNYKNNIVELKRYASNEEIRPFRLLQISLIGGSLLLFLFPEKIQVFISSLLGVYIILKQIINIIVNKNNIYYRFGFFNIVAFLFGFTLVVSPLILSKFIVSILSVIVVLIGSYLISISNRLRRRSM